MKQVQVVAEFYLELIQKVKALISDVILGSSLLTYIMQKISIKNRTTLQVDIQVQREVISFLRFKSMQSADDVVEQRRNAYKAAEKESSMCECHYIYTSSSTESLPENVESQTR